MYWQTDRQKRKEFEGVVAERKAKEKNEAWIRELEARDEEEREIRAMREAKRKGVKYIKEEKLKETPKEGIAEKVQEMVKDVEGNVNAETKETIVGREKEAKGILESVREMIGGKK